MIADNKKFYQILGVICIVGFLSCIIASQFSYISDLKKEIKTLQEENSSLHTDLDEYGCEELELKGCPVCGKEVRIKQIDTSFQIECDKWNNDGCGLTTGYYKSKSDLIKNWNNED